MIFYSASNGGFYLDDVHDGIPSDAIEITADEHSELLEGQASGKQIVHGADGKPTLADVVVTPQQRASAARAQRDALLTATDWTQLRDVPDATAALWSPYRQALRDVPTQKGFPSTVAWPTAPGA